MDKRKQQIALAKLHGWKECEPVEIQYMWRVGAITTAMATWTNPAGVPQLEAWIPNYHEDLDAIHEVENWMAANTALTSAYVMAIQEIVCDNFDEPLNRDMSTMYFMIRAEPAQRIEALLRIFNLWEPD
jgi:hypothetical protein